ncbi:MAG: O-antigen ligase family protein [Candidatus Omnitrophica bacterium]|nr:O-antigen ligase family protein [Candidatus Omnitrophota bacterium]
MKINLTEGLLAIFILSLSIFTFRSAYDYTLVRLLIANIFVFLCALSFFGRRRLFSAPLPILFSLAGFVLFVSISVACSVFPPATMRELPHFLTYILIFMIASQIYPTPFVIGSWILAVVIISCTGWYDHVQTQAIVTPLGNKNFFAGYLIMVIPITIITLWQKIVALGNNLAEKAPRPPLKTGRNRPTISAVTKHRAPRRFNNYLSLTLVIPLILVVILFLTLLVLADSQASQAGLAVGLLFLAFVAFGKFIMPRLKTVLRILTLSLLIIALALTAFIGAKKGTPYILKNVRYPLWKGSADMVAQKPMTGFGPGSFLAVFQRFRPADYYNRQEVAPLSDHSHNEYLELASESGLPALVFFLIFLASVLILSISKMKNSGFIASQPAPEAHSPPAKKSDMAISPEWFLLAGLLSGLIAILVDGLFSTNLRTFSVVSVFWVLLGLCAAIINKDSDVKLQTANIKPKKNLKTSSASNSLGFSPQSSLIWMAIMVFSVFSAGLIAREIKGQVYYREGIAARNAQNWPVAIAQYKKAIAIDPANLQAAYKLSFVYANANQTEDAIKLYREILRISPNFAKTYYNLALLSLKLNDKDSAVTYLNLGLRYDPYDKETQKILNMLINPDSRTQITQNQSSAK